jgi:hypothetical protein
LRAEGNSSFGGALTDKTDRGGLTHVLRVITCLVVTATFAKFGFWFSGYFYPAGHSAF